ncbi:hypothetical protein BJ138DRAFT_1149422, partial [Hygrophoropsis aurantiaca]
MDLESTRAWASSIIVPSHPAASHELPNYTPQDHHIPYPPPPMSQPQPSYPPGPGPNSIEATTQVHHYPPGHAYRRSHSNSPFRHTSHPSPYPIPSASTNLSHLPQPQTPLSHPEGPEDLKQEIFYSPSAAELYNHAQVISASSAPGTEASGHYPPGSVTRLPPILQVEKKQVTTTATQAASASRRRNAAHFECPVPGCGSTFTRRFNLRGHLRSHTEERPYVCGWPGCTKGFARQHDCKRHQALHTNTRPQANICQGCKKPF